LAAFIRGARGRPKALQALKPLTPETLATYTAILAADRRCHRQLSSPSLHHRRRLLISLSRGALPVLYPDFLSVT
jgi:hypothetical protein